VNGKGSSAADRALPEVDVVIVGLGWAGGILAAELTKAGLRVVGLERGPNRSGHDPAYVRKHDELKYKVRTDLMQDTSQETWTLRHDLLEQGLPLRYLGAFRPGTGVGGSSLLYAGAAGRYAPWNFDMRSQTIARYGPKAIPHDASIQDWGITYEDLEPYYDRHERMVGVAGRAGNIAGVTQPGGDPFEGPRTRDFPLPPLKSNAVGDLFRQAAEQLGYHPFPTPAAILSKEYTNPDGISRTACAYCGDCSAHACAVGAKGDPVVTVLPVAQRTGLFELRANANVFKILHDGKRASGVLYFDSDYRVVEQPASIVILTAFAFNNVRLLLQSGMGRPYDPITGQGVIGKNFCYQTVVGSMAFFRNRMFKRYMGSNSAGNCVDDLANDNFDHTGLGFIGGARLMSTLGGAPISSLLVPEGTPTWGPEWKEAIRRWYDRAVTVTVIPDTLAYQSNYLDLDPVYKDSWGNPLLRMTFDWHDNERAIARYAAQKLRDILMAMHPDELVVRETLPSHFDAVKYQSTHPTGGAIMGSERSSSAVNNYLQMWDFHNVWVVGGSAFPQGTGPAPTGTICALAYRAADGIVHKYVKHPALLS
jgi:gluconate 2-dehydrogenase alpha chain